MSVEDQASKTVSYSFLYFRNKEPTLFPVLDPDFFNDDAGLVPGVLLLESFAGTVLLAGELYVTLDEIKDGLSAEFAGDGLGTVLKEFMLDCKR